MPPRPGRLALWTTAHLAVWGWLLSAGAASHGQQAELNPGLAPLLRYFELQIVSGRIAARSPYKDRKLESEASNVDERGNSRRERLSVTLSGEATTVSYELAASDRQISFEILDGHEVILRHEAKGGDASAALTFLQPATGPVSLRLGEGASQREFVAENLWRLMVMEPEACRDLTAVLQFLKPEWRLAETARAAEQSLYESVRAMSGADQTNLRRWVDELASDRFSRRQAAERNLREEGRDALPYLMSLDWRRLDAEQRFRLRALFQELSAGGADDTPERVALWLIRDPKLWLKLLERDDESHRRLALEQLERLLGRRIAFDPAADEATRRQQLEAARKAVESRE